MRLKRLELCGFKSFVDKTAITFPEGVSAIVGPNGCGKSNIVDAIQWVTGEQSMKQLRGKAKDDVIFAGSTLRPATNLAEVTITFANDNGSVPEQFRQHPEIQVTRRLYRSGESGYYINKTPCRLKDIHHLLAGSGIGARTYSVIQQGSIGAITESGPNERRVFIEEAAGITRYKQRKKEALGKVESTRQNLLRVMDIITEVERQMKGLERQAKKAGQYRELSRRARKVQVAMAAWDHGVLSAEVEETDRLLVRLKDREMSHSARLGKLDAAVEKIRHDRARMVERISEREAAKNDMERAADRMENDLSHTREETARLKKEADQLDQEREKLHGKQKEITEELEKLAAEKQALSETLRTTLEKLNQEREASTGIRTELAELEKRLENEKARHIDLVANEARYRNNHQNAGNTKQAISRRLKKAAEDVLRAEREVSDCSGKLREAEKALAGSREESAQLEADLNAVEKRLEEKRRELSDALKTVQELELARGKIKSQLGTLKKMDASRENYKDGVRALLERHNKQAAEGGNGVLGVVADVIHPERTYAAAVEAVLGDALQYVLVRGRDEALAGMKYLREENRGRAGFIPVTGFGTVSSGQVDNPLLAHVRVDEGYEPLVGILLEGISVAADLDEALSIQGKNGFGTTVVTRDGQHVLLPNVLVGGGMGGVGQGILSRREQIDELENSLADATARLEAARENRTTLETELKDTERKLQKAVMACRESSNAEREAEKAVYQHSSDKKRAEKNLEFAQLTHSELAGEEDDADRELERYEKLMGEIATEVEEARLAVAATTERMDQLKIELDAFSEKTGDLKAEMTSHQARLDYLSQSEKRLREFSSDWDRQLAGLEEQQRKKRERAEAIVLRIGSVEKQLAETCYRLDRAREELERETGERDRIEAELKENDEASARIRDERDTTQQKVRDLELEQQKRRINLQSIADRIEEATGKSLARMLKDPEMLALADEGERERARAELETLRNKLARLGDVNMGAIDEHAALVKRHEFLCRQRDDLDQAIEALQKVIRKINRYTQARFKQTFADVNAKLQEIFPRLFHGGHAELILSEPDNPLETGVEYMVNPPGKKVTRMSLLSGGEKALASIAFVFAIFLIRPASFCLMDEIDAPLDEANVHRFNELLRIIGEKSQIVMITHNKRSMEFADVLFGVTMENKGVSKLVSVNLERGNPEPELARAS